MAKPESHLPLAELCQAQLLKLHNNVYLSTFASLYQVSQSLFFQNDQERIADNECVSESVNVCRFTFIICNTQIMLGDDPSWPCHAG